MADVCWLSDAQWAVIEPFMPRTQAGPEREDTGALSPASCTPSPPVAVVAFWS